MGIPSAIRPAAPPDGRPRPRIGRCISAVAIGPAVLAGVCPMNGQTISASKSDDGWASLFNGGNFGGWYSSLLSTGKYSDPKKVFKVENGMVHGIVSLCFGGQ